VSVEEDMTGPRLKIEASGNEIVVTLPGTSLEVTYRKCLEAPGLVAKSLSFWLSDDLDAPISRADFLALAWRVANDKARELGWIV
jgi:hypothetical protein